MTLDEAIKHCYEKAEEIRKANEEMPTDCKLCEDLCKCGEEHIQLARWLEELVELRKFVQFVTSEVVDDTFEESADCFAEVICRKLVKLGYVEIKDDTYLDIVNVKRVDENNSRKRGDKE